MKYWNKILLAMAAAALLLFASAIAFLQIGVPGRVPVLVYHCVGENPASPEGDGLFVSERTFARQMAFLHSMGYETIFAKDITGPLPRNPIVITFDDGYENNYTQAFPILERYGMKATIFVIGSESDRATPGRLSWEQMRKMEASGLVDIQSHTYDLHDIAASGAYAQMPQPQETPEAYGLRIQADMAKQREAFLRELGHAPQAAAFPNGYHTQALDQLYAQGGCTLRFSIEPHAVQLQKQETLLPRIPVFSWTRLPLELLYREIVL